MITFRPVVHHNMLGLARLGQGKDMKARTDNECVLDLV